MDNPELDIPPLPSRRELPRSLEAEGRAVRMLQTVAMAVALGFVLITLFSWPDGDTARLPFKVAQGWVRF